MSEPTVEIAVFATNADELLPQLRRAVVRRSRELNLGWQDRAAMVHASVVGEQARVAGIGREAS